MRYFDHMHSFLLFRKFKCKKWNYAITQNFGM